MGTNMQLRRLCGILLLLILGCALTPVVLAATYNLDWARNVNDQGTTTILEGDTVTWTWTESSTHTVEVSGVFDSGRLSGTGTTFSYTFDDAGSYDYFCDIHSNMRGTILVLSLDPTFRPTAGPSAKPTNAPVVLISERPTAPSSMPSSMPTSPTSTPSSVPSLDLSEYLSKLLQEPQIIRSGSYYPAAWSVTLYVREHRHVNDMVSFNTRAYCYNDVCSYPGPTIEMHPGDNLTLTLINELGAATDHHAHNVLHGANNTNIHTHGLHIDPKVDSIFVTAGPGESLVYEYELPIDHAPGLHWYHAHYHGSSTLQLMGGLAGALEVIPFNTSAAEPGEFVVEQGMPTSITEATSHLVVITHLVFAQDVDGTGAVTQGCGNGWTCDAESQAPLCTGSEESSPFDAFRIYSLAELSVATGSTMDINAVFTDNSTQDFILVNGQHLPTIEATTDSAVILRVLHAAGGKPMPLTLSDEAASVCNMTVLAWDGVYLNARLPQTAVKLVAASRADVELICWEGGIFTLRGDGADILTLLVHVSNVDEVKKPSVTDAELAAIVRPWYLSDLAGDDIVANSTYDVTINQDNRNHSVCGYVIGAGPNCTDISNAELCHYDYFWGQRGSSPGLYLNDNKLVTFIGAINEWTLHGTGTAFHPLHIHVNHFQVVSWSSSADFGEDEYIQIGQWRDTVPPIAEKLMIRFRSADFPGETVMHCHFQRHEDLGMMDTFLVADVDTYKSIYSAVPTATPTALPTTAAPTTYPTTSSPSLQPTPVPTANVSVVPTLAPTESPTPAPTIVPSIEFDTGISISGFSYSNVSDAERESARNATAQAMGISLDMVSSAGENSTAVDSRLRQRRRSLAEFIVTFNFNIEVPLAAANYTNATALFIALQQELNDAVEDGEYIQLLEASAAANSVSLPDSLEVTSVEYSEIIVITPSPSLSPTPTPTDNPSVLPTRAPSFGPSLAPTFSPTEFSTRQPSFVKTLSPTAPPTLVPTARPSYIRTSVPTAIPTILPSVTPTLLPSAAPTTNTTSEEDVDAGSDDDPGISDSRSFEVTNDDKDDQTNPTIVAVIIVTIVVVFLVALCCFCYIRHSHKFSVGVE